MPLDPPIAALLQQMEANGASGGLMRDDDVGAARTLMAQMLGGLAMAEQPTEVPDPTSIDIPSDAGAIPALVYRPATDGPHATLVFLHGGGFALGDAASYDGQVRAITAGLDAVVVSVDYRLAPEHPDPYGREDMYAALEWSAAQAGRGVFRPDRIMVAGASAGGGLAAGMALAARDRGGPVLCGQVLDYPMLDDRCETLSTRQFDGVGVWDRVSNITGWDALLGDARGTDAVSSYAAPSRATDLRGLPAAFIDVGAAEIFRDEAIAYADAIWRAGGDAELHVWSGAFHACDLFAPHTAVGRSMIATRNSWVEKILAD